MKRDMLPLLACPVCGGGLDFDGTSRGERLVRGLLLCRGCSTPYQVLDELPLLKDQKLSAGEWQWEVDVSELRDFDAIRAAYDAALPADVRIARTNIIDHILAGVSGGSGPILDIATGMGTLFRPLAAHMAAHPSQGRSRECLASDVDDSVLRGTQRKLRQEGHSSAASLLVCDAKHLALQDEVIGAVVSFGGLANVPDGSKALLEAARILQPGGLLTFSTLLLQEDSPSFHLATESGFGDLMSAESVLKGLAAAELPLVEQRSFVTGTWPGCPYDLLPLEGDRFVHEVFTARKRASQHRSLNWSSP